MNFMFYLLATVAVVSALMVVTRRNTVHSALWLVITFFAVAGLFILQRAELLAAVQVLVYAGGIMVLFLFVIMLVNVDQVESFVRSRVRVSAAVILAAVLVGTVGGIVAFAGAPTGVPVPDGGVGTGTMAALEGAGNLEAVGTKLLTDYLLAFELVSVVLLVAIVGAIVLCQR